jgi:hypothetical protein
MSGTSANIISDQLLSPCASGEVSQLERSMPKTLSHHKWFMAFPYEAAHGIVENARCFSLEDKESRLIFSSDDNKYAKRYQEAELRVLRCMTEELHQGLVLK